MTLVVVENTKITFTMSLLRRVFLLALAALELRSSQVAALAPLEIKGYKFFDSETGCEVVVRGIDYYPRPNSGDLNRNSLDLFTEGHRNIWERDIPFLQELGVNAIRLYAVDAMENHDAFMYVLTRTLNRKELILLASLRRVYSQHYSSHLC